MTFLTFKKYLQQLEDEELSETPVAAKGDWNLRSEEDWKLFSYSEYGIDKEWTTVLGTFKVKGEEFELRTKKLGNTSSYILGCFEEFKTPFNKEQDAETRFRVILSSTTHRDEELEVALSKVSNKYKHIINMSAISIHPDYRFLGLASDFYDFLADSGLTLMGDHYQFLDARRLWSKLSKNPNYIVDVVDLYKEKIIKSDTILSHGRDDEDFDDSVWSLEPDESKAHIRPVLSINTLKTFGEKNENIQRIFDRR